MSGALLVTLRCVMRRLADRCAVAGQLRVGSLSFLSVAIRGPPFEAKRSAALHCTAVVTEGEGDKEGTQHKGTHR